MKKNKTSKYLKYVLGEIVLVVLGILIALQINNWNEDKKRRNTEVNLLLELKDNLTTDLHDIRYNINEDSETLLSNEIILDQFEKKIPFHEIFPKFSKICPPPILCTIMFRFPSADFLSTTMPI